MTPAELDRIRQQVLSAPAESWGTLASRDAARSLLAEVELLIAIICAMKPGEDPEKVWLRAQVERLDARIVSRRDDACRCCGISLVEPDPPLCEDCAPSWDHAYAGTTKCDRCEENERDE